MTIAGGIMGALFHRERTGEAVSVDVSLLGVGLWAMSPAVALSLQIQHAWRPPPASSGGRGTVEPARRHLSDPGWAVPRLFLPPGFPLLAEGLPGHRARGPHHRRAIYVARAPVGQCRRPPARSWPACSPRPPWPSGGSAWPASTGSGPSLRTPWKRSHDPQVVANGYVGETQTADGMPFQLVTTPVQFDGVAAPPKRGPEFNEHCEEILASIDCDTEAMVELKLEGIVA